jgi:hypothetical protein
LSVPIKPKQQYEDDCRMVETALFLIRQATTLVHLDLCWIFVSKIEFDILCKESDHHK